MTVTVTPESYIIGPAKIYYRAVGVATPWTSVGSTLDDAVLRVTTEWFRPDNINGPLGYVQGLDILRRVMAEIEFTMPEVAGTKLALAIPGSAATTATGAVKTSGHLDTTLSADSVVGATTISLTSAANGAAGDAIKIGTGATAEYRTITLVATNDVSFRDPLIFAHSAAEVVEEADDDNRSYISAPTLRRQPDSAYYEWALVAESGQSEPHELRIPRGISQTESAEITVADDSISGIRVVIGARYYGPDLTQTPFKLYYPA